MDSVGRARTVTVRPGTDPAGLVLVLHGGADRPGRPPVSPTQLSVLRMVPLARRVARAGDGRLAVRRLLNSSRGWDPTRTPVEDARWALAEARRELGELPVCLVGHSLGGRAALLAGGLPGVAGVVALNPWLHADDARGLDPKPGRVLIVHGTDDRVADPARSRRVGDELRASGVDVTRVDVDGGRHAMLGRAAAYARPTDAFVRALLVP